MASPTVGAVQDGVVAAHRDNDPAWLSGLASVLSGPMPTSTVLLLPDLLSEVDGWLRHRRLEPWRPQLRESLRHEVQWSVNNLASCRSSFDGPLKDYLRAVEDALSDGPPTDAQRHAAVAAGEVVRAALITPASLRAFWQDLVTDARSAQRPHLVATAARALAIALDAAGHDVVRLLTHLARVLGDEATAVAEAEVSLGRRQPPITWCELRGTSAGVSVGDRLELCELLIAAPPPWGRCIAWVAFKDAQVDTVLHAGPCTFLNAHWALGNAESERGHDFPGRRELQDEFSRPRKLEPDERVALVRVDLGSRSPAGALPAGQDLVRTLTDTAHLRSGGSRWLPFGWEMLLVDGRRVSSRTFAPDDVVSRWPRPYVLERTAEELAKSGNRLGAVLARSPLPPDLAEAVRTATEATPAHLRSRILLYDRVVELVAAFCGQESADELLDLIARSWPLSSWRADVLRAVESALDAGRWTEPNRREQLSAALKTSTPAGGYTLNLVAVAERTGELLGMFPSTWEACLSADVLYTFHSVPAYLAYLETSITEATRLRARLRRVRNALVHGNPVQTKVIETVTAFAAYLSDAALSEALNAFQDGHDMLARLRQFDAERQHDLALVTSGTTPAALLRLRGL